MRISLAMCTFNGGRYLPKQLQSIVDQIRRPDEVIVCDDGSTDGTVDLLRTFAERAPFAVDLTRNNQTLGSTRNFDLALSRCRGDVILLCDQDDVWAPSKLARFEAEFATHPSAGIVASDQEIIDANGIGMGFKVWEAVQFRRHDQERVRAGRGPRIWLRFNTLTGAAMGLRADLRSIVLPIPPEWVHDAWIAFIGAAIAPVRLISEPLSRYRLHDGQQIGASPRTLSREIARARRRHAEDFRLVAERFTAAGERLEHSGLPMLDSALLPLVRAKIDFARTQERMRRGTRLGRSLPALAALLRGRYHRFGRGWKSFAADLFL
jgi:glycosyltransferase involved in cell wall biosynthesis